MDNDKTVMVPKSHIENEPDSDRTILLGPDTLDVRRLGADGKVIGTFSFAHDFTAGRALDNDIAIDSNLVSRHHLAVKQERGGWWIYNLKSVNGVYINDKLIENCAPLHFPISISLGHSGIGLAIQKSSRWLILPEDNAQRIVAGSLETAGNAQASKSHRNLTQEEIKARLLAEEEAQDAGDYTRMVRKLIHEDRTIRKKSYKKAIWALGILVGVGVVY